MSIVACGPTLPRRELYQAAAPAIALSRLKTLGISCSWPNRASAGSVYGLGLVSLVAIPGQIGFGHLSDRIGREWVWMIGNVGFVICYVALVLLRDAPTAPLLFAMVLAQGTLGYSLTSVMGAIPAEIFEGPHY